MTTEELRKYFSETYGLEPWPRTFEVDAETYGILCNDLIAYLLKHHAYRIAPGGYMVDIRVGRNGGIMFKGVELLLKVNK